MGNVGNIWVTLGLKIDEFKKNMSAVDKAMVKVGDKFQDVGKKLTITGGAITAAMGLIIAKTANLGDEFKDLSQRTGIAVETLSSFKLAADKSGTSVQGFATGMKGLSRVMYEAASGGKEAQEAFKSVGVSATDSSGKLRPLDQVMLDVADRFAGMADGAEKNALAMKLFGRSGMDLIPMLNLGRKGLQENIDKMQKYGVVTRAEAEAGDAFNDAMKDLQAATGGLTRAIGNALIPALTGLATKVADTIAKVTAWAKEHPGLTHAISGTVLGLGAFMTALGTVSYGIGTVLKELPKLKEGLAVLKAFAGRAMVFTFAIAGVAIIAAGVAKMIADFKRLREEGKTTAEALRTQFLDLNPFKGLSREGMGKFLADMDEAKNRAISLKGAGILLADAFNAVKGAFDAAVTPAAVLSTIFKDFGLKTKTELTAELKAAEDALRLLKASVEATPGQVKVLEDKIVGLKEAMSGAKVETKSLAEQLGLLLRVDLEKKYQDMLTALTAYRGKLTEGGEQKLITDLIALRAELDGTKPSFVSLGDTIATVFENINAVMSDSELASIGDDTAAQAERMQKDFEAASQNIVNDILSITPSAELLELKFKTIGDAMGISAATVQVALYNIQAEFLRTIGIIVPLIESIPATTAPAVQQTKNYFDGLFNDIASGFGNTIQQWLSGATTFKDFMSGIWGNIRDSFFRMIGEMIAGWTINFVKKLITDAIDVGKSIAKSIGGALGGVGQAAGSMAGSFLTAASSIANIVTAVASVVSLLKSPPTGAADGMGRVVERQDQQTAILGSILEFQRNDERWGWQTSIKVLENIAYTQFKTANEYLKTIAAGIGNITGHAAGYSGVVSRPTLFVAGERGAEHVQVTPMRQSNTQPAIYITPVVIPRGDKYIIEFLTGAMRHGQMRVPAGAVGG